MREARYVSLIPRTTLHSDSEQVWPFFYNNWWPYAIKNKFYYIPLETFNEDDIFFFFFKIQLQVN
jgi:hypothetical protein